MQLQEPENAVSYLIYKDKDPSLHDQIQQTALQL